MSIGFFLPFATRKIYESKDRLGITGKCYIENSKHSLIVIVRGDIITSYEPSEKYLNKVKEDALLWKET